MVLQLAPLAYAAFALAAKAASDKVIEKQQDSFYTRLAELRQIHSNKITMLETAAGTLESALQAAQAQATNFEQQYGRKVTGTGNKVQMPYIEKLRQAAIQCYRQAQELYYIADLSDLRNTTSEKISIYQITHGHPLLGSAGMALAGIEKISKAGDRKKKLEERGTQIGNNAHQLREEADAKREEFEMLNTAIRAHIKAELAQHNVRQAITHNHQLKEALEIVAYGR